MIAEFSRFYLEECYRKENKVFIPLPKNQIKVYPIFDTLPKTEQS